MSFHRFAALFAAASTSIFILAAGCSSSSPPDATPSALDTEPDAASAAANVARQKEPESLVIARRVANVHERLTRSLTPASDAWVHEPLSPSFTSPGWRATENKEFGYLGARIPERANGVFEVGLARFDRFRLRFTETGAADVVSTLHEGRVVYENAHRATDAIITTDADHWEEVLLLKSADAPTSFSWNAKMPSGLSASVNDKVGSVVFIDRNEKPILWMPRPYAIDAKGERRDATLVWTDGKDAAAKFEVTLDTKDLDYPIVLDPAIETAVWVYTADYVGYAATPVTDMGLAYDRMIGKTLVVYGGQVSQTATNTPPYNNGLIDTAQARYTGNAWVYTTDTSGITNPQRERMAMTSIESLFGFPVFFGGEICNNNTSNPCNSLGVTNDLIWLSNGLNWNPAGLVTAVACNGQPAGVACGAPGMVCDGANHCLPGKRRSAAMAEQPGGRGDLVMFGGANAPGTILFGDTCTWTESAPQSSQGLWACSTPATTPSARYDAAMVFDKNRGVDVLFGGTASSNGTTALGDTWEWSGAAWTLKCASCGPVARWGHRMAYDSNMHRTILVGGYSGSADLSDTWEWDGTTWTATCGAGGKPACATGALKSGGFAYDQIRRRAVYVGGTVTGNPFTNVAVPAARSATWEYHGRGGSCSTGADCDTGNCVTETVGGVATSVCCESSSCPTCQQCDAAGNPGVCSLIPQGTDNNANAAGGGPCTGTSTCDGNGRCLTKTGQSCTSSGQCAFFNCADIGVPNSGDTGVCCDSPCGQSCDVCKSTLGASVTGTCTVLASGGSASPSGSCGGYLCAGAAGCPASCTINAQCVSGYYCGGGTCQQKKANGVTCGCATGPGCSECSSGNCYDGVCCDGACGATCVACTAAKKGSGADGACGTIAAGSDPDNECTDNGAASCGTNGSCSGHGTCDNYAAGTSCGAASCSGTTVTLKQCNGTGSCLSVSGSNCDPYVCAAGACKNPCVLDTDCINGDYCAAGICKPKSNNGAVCTAANQCVTNSCVDGYCCNSPCSGACDVCSATPGTCTLLAQGSAGSPACTAGFVCTGSSANCPASCGSDNDCAGGFFCNGSGACQAQKASTGACDLTADCKVPGCRECTTGFCSDGLCCNTACGGACDSCNSLGAVGTCTNVTGPGSPSCGGILCTGSSPTCPSGCTTDAQCAGGYYCSANGTCQARKAQGQSCNLTTDCKQAGTCAECGSAGGCVDGFCCNTACSGACDNCSATPGTCNLAVIGFPGNPACGTYLCSGSAATCPGSCTLDSQCSTGNYCNGAACVPKKALGGGCGAGKECTSGFCADGVCCDGACGGPCDACNSSGQCLNVAGAGAPSCSPYVCSGTSAACPPGCTSDANCASGFYCNGSACLPKLGLGQVCTGANQCALSNCVDGVCCASACGGACDACNASGQCVNVAGGGNPTCGAYLCSGTAPTCPSSCSTDAQCANGYFCSQGGTCQPQRAQGQSCGATDCSQAGCRECSSGNCADGFCCNQACNGACDTCSVTAGVCTFLAAGNSGAPSCAPYLCSGSGGTCPTSCTTDTACSTGNFCDGVACAPKRAQGAACTAKNQCASNSCVDGVCCDTACTGTCQACLAALKESGANDGVCGNAKAGGDPHNDCPDDGVASCDRDGTCNGAGACRLYTKGTACSGGTTCVGNTVTGNVCDGVGTCSPNTMGVTCAPYNCKGTKCAIPCASDDDCTSGNFCDLVAGGTCKPQLAQGLSCGGDNQCLSTHCSDGACCDTKCDGFCQACSAAKRGGNAVTGTCGPITNGLDPDSECPDNGPTACKEDGYCNGSGACRFYSKGTTCGSSQCTSGVTTTQSCDGLGTCGVGTVTNCAPFTCADVTSCALTCVDDTLCGFGNYCASGLCVPKVAIAQPCTADNECTSLHCVENVCCDAKCDGTCQSCTATLKQSGDQTGTCGPAKVDTDPHNNCIDDGVTGCQHNGNCDGQGNCALYKNGASCGDTSCVGDSKAGFQQSGFACNGGGSCQANAVVDCGQFACKSSACLSTCADATDCRDGAFCDVTAMPPVCKLKSKNGTKCTTANECESQSCADGFCCNTACQGQCEACDIMGAEGSCAPVSGKPHSTREACAKATADNACAEAQCDGNTRDTCAGFVGSTVECRTPACKGGVATLSAKCDGKGQCPSQTTKVCEPYACDATTCKESCKADADCSSGYRCDATSGKCLSGATCDGDHTINAPNQPPTDCRPYRCLAGGMCKTSCVSVDDCVAGFACDLNGKCGTVTISQPAGDSGGCGCRVGASTENVPATGSAASLLLALGAFIRVRRSRRARGLQVS